MRAKRERVRDWRDDIRVGDVLRGRGGALRVVRDVTRGTGDYLFTVTFAIMRCSWTTALLHRLLPR